MDDEGKKRQKMKDANGLNSEIEEKNNTNRSMSMINIDEEKWCASSSSDLL